MADCVVFDTNVLTSATLWPRGGPFELTQRAASGQLRHVTSRFILDEVTEVLVRKFRAPVQFIDTMIDAVTAYSIVIVPRVIVPPKVADPADNQVLSCAVSARAQFLVTGDRALIKLGRISKCRIVTPAEMLGLLM